MLDFSCDLNFLKPNVKIDFTQFDTTKEYSYKKLLSLLAKRYKLPKTQIELYNGYSSAIYSFLKFIDLKRCFIYSPCELEYKNAAKNLNYEIKLINRFDSIYYPIKEQSVVVFMNPSFLDGTFYDLDKLLQYWCSKECTILIDESFFDYCHLDSSIQKLSEYENLYIIKDFSKYFSNRLLNIASICSKEENINRLRKYEPSSKLSIYDIRYLEESLKDEKFKNITNSINIKNRIEVENSFFSKELVETIYQSSTNSLLIKLKEGVSSENLQNKLEQKGIKILSCKGYDFLDETYINIYIKSKDYILELKEVLDDY